MTSSCAHLQFLLIMLCLPLWNGHLKHMKCLRNLAGSTTVCPEADDLIYCCQFRNYEWNLTQILHKSWEDVPIYTLNLNIWVIRHIFEFLERLEKMRCDRKLMSVHWNYIFCWFGFTFSRKRLCLGKCVTWYSVAKSSSAIRENTTNKNWHPFSRCWTFWLDHFLCAVRFLCSLYSQIKPGIW